VIDIMKVKQIPVLLRCDWPNVWGTGLYFIAL